MQTFESEQDLAVSTALAGDYPRLTLPSELRSAVARALIDGHQTHYTDGRGVPVLREQLAGALGVEDPNNVLLLSGEQEARFLAIQALRGAGAVPVLPRMVHPGAALAAELRGGAALRFDAEQDSAAAVAGALAGGATLVYLENPNRLTGRLIDGAQLEAMAAAIVDAGASAICDEGLAGWLEPGVAYTSLAGLPGMAGRTLRLGTPWPGLGLEYAGPAYLAGPARLIAPCLKLKQAISICTSTLTQWMLDGGGAVQSGEHASRIDALSRRRAAAVSAALAAGVDVLPGQVSGILALRAAPGDLAQLATGYGNVADGAPWGAAGVSRLTITPQRGN